MNREDPNPNLAIQTSDRTSPSLPENPNPQNPRWRRWLFPAIVIAAIVGGLGWVAFNRLILPLLFSGPMAAPPMPVNLTNPKVATISDSSDYAANLDSRQSVTLQPRVAGQISDIYVRPGERVEAGQPILQIDAAEQQAQVASRRSAAGTAAAEVGEAEADVDAANDTLRSLEAKRAAALANVRLNEQEYERYRELSREGAASRQVLDQRLNALRTAQADLQQAEADIQAQGSAINRTKATVARNKRALEQAQANISEGQAQLQYYTIKAPFSGTVGDIPVKVGDGVTTTTPLLNVTQNEQLEIQIQIPLERAAALRTGLPVRLLDDQGREGQTGQISFVAPNVDATTQSVQVKARFANPGSLRASQFVRARVIWSNRPGVLVPTTAVSRLGGRDFIFVAAPFREAGCQGAGQGAETAPDQLVAAQRPIKLGKIVNNDQEILEGLSARDRIITSGILQLQNCSPIASQ